jgi:hypothetical protein
LRLVREIVAGMLSVVNTSNDPKHSQPSESRSQRIGIEAESRERGRTLTRHEQHDVVEERQYTGVACLGFEIEPLDRDSLVQFGVPSRGQREKRIAARRLDLHDARACLAQSRDGERTGKVLRDRDDSDSSSRLVESIAGRSGSKNSERRRMAVYKLCVSVNIEVQVLFLTRRRGGRGAAEDFAMAMHVLCEPGSSRREGAGYSAHDSVFDAITLMFYQHGHRTKSVTGGKMRYSATLRPLRLRVKNEVLHGIPGNAAS